MLKASTDTNRNIISSKSQAAKENKVNSKFATKFNLWKSSVKKKASIQKQIKKETMSAPMYPNTDNRNIRRARPIPESSNYARNRMTSKNMKPEARVVQYSEDMLNGFQKMKPASADDHTAETSSQTLSTRPTFDDTTSTFSEQSMDANYAHHSFKVDKHTFTVDRRYSYLRTIGSGAYGVVISAEDHDAQSKVAIKMVPKAFHDEIDAKRILREIKLLKHFNHRNIISIQDMMPPLARQVEDFRDVYIVTDLMETDLHRIIYSKQNLSMDHVQYFLYQILCAVKYMHSANVLHRDLKPSNLLVNSNCDLKVCDFGLARGVTATHDEDVNNRRSSLLLTEYVVTRWYRAPEIMLACHEYSKPIDMWSVGCIFAELLGRKPFLSGDDYIEQLTLITEKLGKLSARDMDFVTSSKAKNFLRKLPDKPVIPLAHQFPKASNLAIDLLGKMLQIHPRKRINVADALKHPFFAPYHNEEDEPTAPTPFDFSFEDEKLHRVRLQELIWQEVGDFRPTCLPVPGKSRTFSSRSMHAQRLYHA